MVFDVMSSLPKDNISQTFKTEDRNQDATIYVGNLDAQVTEELLWELFLQVGPVVNCYVPKDRVTQSHSGYGFVEFKSEEDADYACKVLSQVKLYGKPIRTNKVTNDKKNYDVGANLFIGNLSKTVDEKLLLETFSVFGTLIGQIKISRFEEVEGEERDNETSSGSELTNQEKNKGTSHHAFINFGSFDAADQAIEAMNGQFLQGRRISVSYAFKPKSTKEFHGTQAERLLAINNPMQAKPMSARQVKRIIGDKGGSSSSSNTSAIGKEGITLTLSSSTMKKL